MFKTESEANVVDIIEGGTGTSHTHTFVDDTTNTTWYMNDTNSTHIGTQAPQGGVYGNSTNVVWNEQVTGDDLGFVPTFTDITYTIQEGSAVNIQYKPQGDTDVYNVTNIPSGYADTGYAIVGTADEILDGVDIQHVMNVTKANDFGSGTGIITLNVTDDASNNVSSNSTPWTKAVSFSGSNEHLEQATSSATFNALRMANISNTASVPSTSGYTSGDWYACPWATAIVFNYDGNNSNQHIWNSGEGEGITDDNVYFRIDSLGYLIFGWGRQGALNECKFLYIGTNTNEWHGIYIAHNGTRLSGSNANAANLSDCFDIRWMGTSDSVAPWNNISTNLSTSVNWNGGSTGGPMDNSIAGYFTIGGIGSNNNFHGKVASMVVTTLINNVAMPSDAEIKKMITDPEGWVTDYKVGNPFMSASGTSGSTAGNFPIPGTANWSAIKSTQVFLMGDGSSDSYGNGIRNYIYPADGNNTKMRFINMASNDIQNVTIPGLS